MDLIAINQINRTVKEGKNDSEGRAVKAPEVEVIAPGTPFSADEDQGNELIAMNAARKATKDDPKPKSGKKASVDGGDANTAKTEEEAVLEQLRAQYETEFGEKPNSRMKAETLRERIAEKQAEGGNEEDDLEDGV